MRRSTFPAPPPPATESESPRHGGVPVLKALLAAWQAAAIYEENNNAYRARREELSQTLKAAFASGGDCRIAYQNGYFFFNGNRLNYDQAFSFGRTLASRFTDLKLGELTIRTDTSPQSIDQALFTLAHTDTRGSDPYAVLSESWSALNIDGVTIARQAEVSIGEWDQESGANPQLRRRRRAQALFGRAEAIVQDFWERVRDRNSLDASTTRRIVHQLIDQIANDEEALLEFAALKDFDEYTYYHSVNVAIYAIAVGMRLGLDRQRLTQLGMAALFHDIGKVKLPRDLITKPQEFNEDDWVQIRRHPALGALTLANLRHIDSQIGGAMAGAFEHHIHMDASGYPKLSAPRELHLFSRIIALSDAFDAMTSGRVYQVDKLSPDEAIRRLLYKGRQWYDPIVLKAFVHVLGVFPVGTLVRLSDGCVAVVVRSNADDLYAPEVLIIRDASGTPTRRAVRLEGRGAHGDSQPLHIGEVLDPAREGINISDYIAVAYQPGEETVAEKVS